jgi:CRP-like cAMP-binding protein
MDLRTFSIFSQLPENQLEAVREAVRLRQFARREIVCHKDDAADGLYLLFTGQLQVMDIAQDGKEIGLNLINPGAFFGELSVIDDRPRSAHIVAIEPSTVGVVPQASARELFYKLPGTAEAMMRHLASLVRSLTDFRVMLALPSAFQRVYALLHKLGKPMPGGLMVIQNLPKQHEVAIMVNTSRETVSRAIAQLISEGVLEKDYRRLIIRRPDRLGELAKKIETPPNLQFSAANANRPPNSDLDT